MLLHDFRRTTVDLGHHLEALENQGFQGFPSAYFSGKKTLKVEVVQTCLHSLLKKMHPARLLQPRRAAKKKTCFDSTKTEEEKIPRGSIFPKNRQSSNALPLLRFSQSRRK